MNIISIAGSLHFYHWFFLDCQVRNLLLYVSIKRNISFLKFITLKIDHLNSVLHKIWSFGFSAFQSLLDLFWGKVRKHSTNIKLYKLQQFEQKLSLKFKTPLLQYNLESWNCQCLSSASVVKYKSQPNPGNCL